jgi:hypothetical protein
MGGKMKKAIWKFEIDDAFDTCIKMPKGAEVLSIQNQNNTICIWALVIPSNEPEDRYFEVFGTGHPIHCDIGIERVFIGTVQVDSFVWHIFERKN